MHLLYSIIISYIFYCKNIFPKCLLTISVIFLLSWSSPIEFLDRHHLVPYFESCGSGVSCRISMLDTINHYMLCFWHWSLCDGWLHPGSNDILVFCSYSLSFQRMSIPKVWHGWLFLIILLLQTVCSLRLSQIAQFEIPTHLITLYIT